jgi:hypothetical protein
VTATLASQAIGADATNKAAKIDRHIASIALDGLIECFRMIPSR